MKQIAVILLLSFVSMTSNAADSARQPLVQSSDVQVPVLPRPVVVDGQYRLAYELHVTNFQRDDIVLRDVEVLGDSGKVSLARFREATLAAIVGRPGMRGDGSKLTIGAGARAVLYLWLTLDHDTALPNELRHTITFDVLRDSGSQRGTLEDLRVEVLAESPVVLGPPLRGGPWAAIYDPHLERGHRTSIYTIDGRARIPARFAIDWIRLDEDGSKARGDASRIENWHGHGEEVLAVADATVVVAGDDMAEPETVGAAQGSMPLENASGNHIVLDIGEGRYVFYEHLKHGSIKVRAGDKVTCGQVIGLLGNSGSSSAGPHLHFHVADASTTLAAEGMPFVFREFDVVGQFDSIAAFRRGDHWNPATTGGIRSDEMPAANTVIVFE